MLLTSGVLKKAICVLLLCGALSATLLGCTTGETAEVQELPASDYTQSVEKPIIDEVASLEPEVSLSTQNDIEIWVQSDDLSNEELVQHALHLLGDDTPVFWWLSALPSHIEHLDLDWDAGTFVESEGRYFYPVGRFDNFAEMKGATEQIVTRRFATENLYFAIDNTPTSLLEIDGRLHRSVFGGSWHMRLIDGSLVSRNDNIAYIEATYDVPMGEIEIYHIRLVREDGSWKLDSFPMLEGNLQILRN